MRFNINKNFILLLTTSIFLFSCSQKNNFDIDLSNLPKRRTKSLADEDKKELTLLQDDLPIKDLEPYENKEKLLSKFKFGKKDPFSRDDSNLNRFTSDFELNGFLNTEDEKYVFVSYLGIQGTISEKSIGGINTNLLPNGAEVVEIDIKKMQLKINFDNENFIFDL